MINQAKLAQNKALLHIFEQNIAHNVRELPSSAILLDSLKTLEIQLQHRDLLSQRDKAHSNQPIWFLAETERNIFLWRAGLSLADAKHFEFWVDIEELIKKRLNQLEQAGPDNPFLNPLWGSMVFDSQIAQNESEYLECFLNILNSIQNHANALSQVVSELMQEIDGKTNEKRIILLPR